MKQLADEQIASVSGGEPRGESSDGRQNDGSDIGDVGIYRGYLTVTYRNTDGSNDGGQRWYVEP